MGHNMKRSNPFSFRLTFLFGLMTGCAIGCIAGFQARYVVERRQYFDDRALLRSSLATLSIRLKSGFPRDIEVSDIAEFYDFLGPKPDYSQLESTWQDRLQMLDDAEALMFWFNLYKDTIKKTQSLSVPISERRLADKDRDGFPEYNRDGMLADSYCLSFSKVGDRELVFINYESESLSQ